MEEIVRTSVYLERESYEKLPRTVKLSVIVKWLVIAAVTPEKELVKKINASEEALRVRDWLMVVTDKLRQNKEKAPGVSSTQSLNKPPYRRVRLNNNIVLNNIADIKRPNTARATETLHSGIPAAAEPTCATAHGSAAAKYYLPQAWSEFLNNPLWNWSWYGHFTFRDYPHPETADKVWYRWIHNLNRSIFGVRYYNRPDDGVIWSRGTEYQRRGAVHYHAVIGSIPGSISRMYWLDAWFKMAGICRIYAYQRGRGAEFYMSKSTYAWKRGEIDLGGPLKARLEYEQLGFPSTVALQQRLAGT